MKNAFAPWALLLLTACSSGQTLEINDTPSEEELLAKTEHALGAKIKETFGQNARLAGAVQQGKLTVLQVANEAAPEAADPILPVAIAIHDPKAGTLKVAAAAFEYKEARVLGDKTALVKASGELELSTASGVRVLAAGIKGDVQPAKDGALLVTQNHETDGDSNSRVLLVKENGETAVLADAPGSDDRASLSPDGSSVLFVSARDGVASFYVTNLDGAEAVRITNTELQLTLDDAAPANFVPVPVNLDRLQWLSNDVVRFDAGGNELWTLNVRTGEAKNLGGAR